ncbi:MAG: zinc ABC transporter substrate-binding protein [Steroidobacteraceae bacterium]
MTAHNPNFRHFLTAIAIFVALAFPSAPVRAADKSGPTVLTGMQATYSLATTLTAGTPIQVQNVPADGREMSMQKDYIARRMDALGKQFSAATAVITITNAVAGDPLYRYAREANIRIVNIDAAVPWSLNMPGVALADSPVSNAAWGHDPDPLESGTAPYFWLSVSNAIRMGDIIASDLAALFPDSATVIGRNLDNLKRSLLALRGDYQNRLMEDSGDVFALTGDFVYLTNDMGLLVDGYFIKQDVRWTKADLDGLTQHLRDNHIKVVLHKWAPSEAIQNAVKAAGAMLVVLDAGDPGIVVDDSLAVDGLQQILRKNLAAIYAALKAK